MSDILTIYLGSATTLKCEELTDQLSGRLELTAAVTAYVYVEKAVDTLVATIPMPHDSEGNYYGTVPFDQANIAEGDRGRVRFFANAGSGKELTKIKKMVVRTAK